MPHIWKGISGILNKKFWFTWTQCISYKLGHRGSMWHANFGLSCSFIEILVIHKKMFIAQNVENWDESYIYPNTNNVYMNPFKSLFLCLKESKHSSSWLWTPVHSWYTVHILISISDWDETHSWKIWKLEKNRTKSWAPQNSNTHCCIIFLRHLKLTLQVLWCKICQIYTISQKFEHIFLFPLNEKSKLLNGGVNVSPGRVLLCHPLCIFLNKHITLHLKLIEQSDLPLNWYL